MFSLSLRRKSAPSQINLPRGPDVSPESSPPLTPLSVKRRRGFSSIRSKKSLSSLLTMTSRDPSPGAGDRQDKDGFVKAEPANYPVYDSNNPDHNPAVATDLETYAPPVKTSRSRSRSRSTSRSRSIAASKNWLDTLAAKLRSVAESFHKKAGDDESVSEQDKHPQPVPVTVSAATVRERTPSPKKSVRFRSSNFSQEQPKTSPINISTKKALFLPTLTLPAASLGASFMRDNDPIPTGRPPDTPVLKTKHQNDYFSMPFVNPNPHASDPGAETPAAECIENPFEDSAAMIEKDGGNKQTLVRESIGSASTAVDKGYPNDLKLPEAGSHKSTSTMTKPLLQTSGSSSSSLDHDTVQGMVAASLARDSFLEPQNPFLTESEASAPPQMAASLAVSPWTLASRDTLAGDIEDRSPSNSPPNPIHEDIRRRMRSSIKDQKSVSSDFDVVFATSPEKPTKSGLTAYAAAAESHRHVTGSSISTTDPVKHVPVVPNHTPVSGSEHSELVPEQTISPLNLKASVSSLSPGRKGRTFRFSNRPEGSPRAEPMTTTSFSMKMPMSIDKTPSPVSVPLPLSVATNKLGSTRPPWRPPYHDQFGWCPFDEKHFAEAFIHSDKLHYMLMAPGGFAKYWKEAQLPALTAPQDGTKALIEDEYNTLYAACKRVRLSIDRSSDEPKSIMAELFSPMHDGRDSNYFAPLENELAARQYSGEVSTNADSSPSHESATESGSDGSTVCSLCRSIPDSHTDSEVSQPCKHYYLLDKGDETVRGRSRSPVSPYKTPTRLRRSPVRGLENTPTQADYSGMPMVKPLNRVRNVGSEASASVRSEATSGDFSSEDEHFVRGIV